MIKPENMPIGRIEYMGMVEIDESFTYVSDSQDTFSIREYIPYIKTLELSLVNDFTTFFVQVKDGDYGIVLGCYGIPFLYKTITRIQ